jgi:hypothetical protein
VALPQVGAARPGRRPLVVSPGHSPPSSLLLAPWVFWQNRIFAVFFGIFPESRISAQKRETRAILLKTALVRVSCIQNTQIREKKIAKVFGKVDTFWTYQGGLDGGVPTAAWRWELHEPAGSLGQGALVCSCCCLRSVAAIGGGGRALPRVRYLAVPHSRLPLFIPIGIATLVTVRWQW